MKRLWILQAVCNVAIVGLTIFTFKKLKYVEKVIYEELRDFHDFMTDCGYYDEESGLKWTDAYLCEEDNDDGE